MLVFKIFVIVNAAQHNIQKLISNYVPSRNIARYFS